MRSMKKETLEIKLSPDETRVQLIGSMSPETLDTKFRNTVKEKLLSQCKQALQNYSERYGEYVLVVDFQETTKISSVGYSVLEADVPELAIQNKAQLKCINFPTAFKPSLETRALYYRLSEQDGIHFRE